MFFYVYILCPRGLYQFYLHRPDKKKGFSKGSGKTFYKLSLESLIIPGKSGSFNVFFSPTLFVIQDRELGGERLLTDLLDDKSTLNTLYTCAVTQFIRNKLLNKPC